MADRAKGKDDKRDREKERNLWLWDESIYDIHII
jgi:hypothetical protein